MSNMLNNPNVRAMMAEASTREDVDGLPTEVSMEGKIIQEKILHILRLYPTISPSMLQVGIGNAIPPSIWRPNYEILRNARVVIERHETHESPGGRFIQYTFVELSPLVIPEMPNVPLGK